MVVQSMCEYLSPSAGAAGSRIGTTERTNYMSRNHKCQDCCTLKDIIDFRADAHGQPIDRCLACQKLLEGPLYPWRAYTVKAHLRACLYNIMVRCTKKASASYSNYGGNGIAVCDDWHDADAFFSWAMRTGFRVGLCINRIDHSDGYHPDNCEWVDAFSSRSRRGNTVLLDAFGETRTLAEWAEDPRCPVTASALYKRFVVRGMPAELAISLPKHARWVRGTGSQDAPTAVPGTIGTSGSDYSRMSGGSSTSAQGQDAESGKTEEVQ